jgi:hypothetical protein
VRFSREDWAGFEGEVSWMMTEVEEALNELDEAVFNEL